MTPSTPWGTYRTWKLYDCQLKGTALPLPQKRPGMIQKIIDFAYIHGKNPIIYDCSTACQIQRAFQVPLVFCLQAHYDIQPVLFTPLKQVLAVRLPLAALYLCHPQNIQFSCYNNILYVYTSFNFYFDKYPAGEISGGARIVALHQTGFLLALYSL